ncbi:hypothetical protein T12_7042 [Trichinella patagoniensis]|uniref:WAP domain-containing protein n=3 Tax=Trichinella TaxID=6333 RepID=A0A0V0ZBC6_9BILA|nr:hypothetical protein T05_14689 [Trichinella murrelli]KRX63199.1 hypothetical protein T09_559 [Trichinella sp. T9]KRY09640.1 hypothetical protein T12_7042 [Trichinella patagoniensis]
MFFSIFIFFCLLYVQSESFMCPDRTYPIQQCPRGRCPTAQYCYNGWCCKNNNFGGNGNFPPFFPPHNGGGWQKCPDGSRHYGRCNYGYCQGNKICINGVCCRKPWNGNPGYPNHKPNWNNNGYGRCPPFFGIPRNIHNSCRTNRDCPYGRKCCQTLTGKVCLIPQ